MAGLVVLFLFALAFVYGLTYPASGSNPTQYCASNGPLPVPPTNPCYLHANTVCTYPQGTVSPAPGCYQTPSQYPNFIAPTATLTATGAFPFGSLVYPAANLNANNPFFYDTYSMVVKGTVISITLALVIVSTGAMIGLALGALSGYFGGWIDEVVMRLTDIFLSVPALLLVIGVIIVGKSAGLLDFNVTLVLIAGAFIVVWWPVYARIVRSQALIVREQRYVEAARASGASHGRILRKHIIPNSVYPVFVQMSLDVGSIPLLVASIVFIGFVLFPFPLIPEWGSVAAAGASLLTSIFLNCSAGAACVIPWWQILFPALAIFFFAISVNFFADGLRDALDPRLRR
jgi:peptide/nickel transport system permease protein